MIFRRGASLLVLLNLADAVSTHIALRKGLFTELNPLLRWAFDLTPGLFWALKIGLLAVVLLFVADSAPEKTATRIVIGANIVYGLILMIHLYNWIFYFWS